jgi:hypothetical protein
MVLLSGDTLRAFLSHCQLACPNGPRGTGAIDLSIRLASPSVSSASSTTRLP